MYDWREQCDDGNTMSDDGCSSNCRVESNWVCYGGSPTSADVCRPSEIAAMSSLVITISGHRNVSLQEIDAASALALGHALGCPGGARDIEVGLVILANINAPPAAAGSTEAADKKPSTTPSPDTSKFHTFRSSVEIHFTAKISKATVLSIDQLAGDL